MKNSPRIIAILFFLLALLMPALCHAGSTISGLPPGGAYNPSTDVVPISRCTATGCDYKVALGPISPLGIGSGLVASGGNLTLNTAQMNSWSAVQTFLSGDLTAADPVFTGGSIELPAGNTAARPGSPVNGMIRYNSDLPGLEAYVNGAWTAAVSSVFGRTGAVTAQSGDYSVAQVTGAAPTASPAFSGTVKTGFLESTLNATTLPAAQTGSVVQIANADGTATRIECDVFGSSCYFTSLAYGGTNASKTALTSGTEIGGYNGGGYNGSALVFPRAAFRSYANQNWTTGANGTYADIATTPNGATAEAEVIRFENDGGVTIPSTVTGGDKGAGTINAGGYYQNGVPLSPPGSIPVAWYGALGIASDDCPAIQNAINAVEALPSGGIVSFSPTVYNCKTALTFDPAFVSFEFNSAVFNSAAWTPGSQTYLFTVANATEYPASPNGILAANYREFFRDVLFIGPGSSHNLGLFNFDTTAGNSYSSRMAFSHIAASGFNYGETYTGGAYLISGFDTQYQSMATCFNMPSGSSNTGENISHSHGMCSQSTLGVYSNQSAQTNTQNFDHFSFDYDGSIADDEAGVINFDTGHFEASQPMTFAFKVADSNGATIRIHGGDWFYDSTGPFSGTSDLIEADGAGTIDIDNMFMQNLGLTSGTLATGTGHIKITNTRGYATSLGNYQVTPITNIESNYLGDPTFAAATPQDLIWISSDPNSIATRLSTSNTNLTNDSATCGGQGSSTQSLKINKTNGAGSQSIVYIAAPIPSRQMPVGSFYYSKPGSQTGTVFLNWYLIQILGYDANGIPVIGWQSSSLGATTVSLTSSALGWTLMGLSQAPANIAPAKATHLVVQINANGMNAGAFCIGNPVFNSM